MNKKQNEICELFCYNKNKVKVVKKNLLSNTEIFKLIEIFKILGDHTRVKILLALFQGELCVCDISHVLSLSLSAVSHQLRLLRNLGLVKYRSAGKMVFYSLKDEYIMKVIQEGINYINR